MENSLYDRWRRYNEISGGSEDLEFKYPALQTRKKIQIVEALTFWRFIFENVKWECKGLTSTEWMKRKESLELFIDNPNPLMRVVAALESLPDAVWRKILWKHNIDFMSFESFLRRISKEQIEVILKNYQDLYSGKVPKVFSSWDCFWGKSTANEFLSEELNYDNRYANKGAMSYNLLGLDFGFNAYPDGVASDKKIVEISPLTFLSVKNHSDDFVVNTEAGGKYWWLYKKARSNYVYKPGRRVRLGTHVCPGFWYTMLVHLLFWVISPLATIGLIGTIAQSSFQSTPWWFIVAFGVAGSLTPAWVFVAMLKFVAIKVFRDSDEAERLLTKLGFIVLSLGAIIMIFRVLPYFLWWLRDAVSILGIVQSCLVAAMIGIYIYARIRYRRNYDYAGIPRRLSILLAALVVSILAKLAFTFRQEIFEFLVFLVDSAKILALTVGGWFVSLWGLVFQMGFLGLLLVAVVVVPLAMLGAVLYVFDMEEERMKKFFDRSQKISKYCEFLAWLVSIGMAVASVIGAWDSGALSIRVSFIIAVVISLYRYVVHVNDPSYKEICRDFGSVRRNNSWNGYYHAEFFEGDDAIFREMLLKNSWIKSLDEDTRKSAIRRAIYLMGQVVPRINWPSAIKEIFSNMTDEILDSISQSRGAMQVLRVEQKELAFLVFVKMARGLSFDQSLADARKDLATEKDADARNEVFIRRMQKVCYVMAFPAIALFHGAMKLGEYAKTLYRLYELFNERCPYITERRILRMKKEDE